MKNSFCQTIIYIDRKKMFIKQKEMDIIKYFYEHPLKISADKDQFAATRASPSSPQTPCFSFVQSNLAAGPGSSGDVSPKLETNPELSPKFSKFPGTTLIDKLDAIMESTKKKVKVMRSEAKCKRRRKTKEQLGVLNVELQKNTHISNKRIHEISNETGLSKLQVYKWYWDLRHKCIPIANSFHC
eukprot:TRINITY_DN5847_c0_g1_i1.p1 TRINITY_DN5847_c0_g1~~TRINITY_DN5847_c0_g1_i1.p1  ORF type:complete len:185 (+),score=31.77 TRINITY_DN5847_c0_g1_i1:140-694(+)